MQVTKPFQFDLIFDEDTVRDSGDGKSEERDRSILFADFIWFTRVNRREKNEPSRYEVCLVSVGKMIEKHMHIAHTQILTHSIY